MKKGKQTWAFLGIGVLLVAAAALGIFRAQQAAQQKKLSDDLATVRARLTALDLDAVTAQQQQVKAETLKVQQSTADVQAQISQPLNSIITGSGLIWLANNVGVTVKDFGTAEPFNVSFAGAPCTAMPVSATIEGETAKLITYVDRLKTDYPTLFIDQADLSVIEGTKEAPGVSFLDLKLLIYTYKGS